MTTLQYAKEELLKGINEIGFDDAKTIGRIARDIDWFIDFCIGRGVTFVEELNEHVIGDYRLFLRVFADDNEEAQLVKTAAVIIDAAAENGLIKKELALYWQTIAPKEFFATKPIGLN